jgi:hypothetical protein
MACNCDVNFKRDFYGEIKLWTGLQNGIAAGAGTVLPVVKVVVCDSCGTAEFKMPRDKTATR